MQPEDMIRVSVDDHLVELPNLLKGRAASKYADETPRVMRGGSKVWTWFVTHAAGATLGSVSAKLDV